jgi:DNA-binding response OmpR family regulator
MSGQKILIIDDDAVTTAVLEEYLSDFGYKIHHAIDGDQGLQKIKTVSPDIVLLDIMMPGKDGIQILKEIKLNPEFASIPILLLTAIDRSNLKVKGLDLGADDYITKPVDRAELLARIKVSLKRSAKTWRTGHILDGDLSNFTLSDLLQSMDLGKKTATIHFPDIKGRLIIRDGHLIKSKQGEFSGMKAINRIFLLEKGKFIVEFNKIKVNNNDKPLRIMKILLQNISLVDEVKNMAVSLPEFEKEIKISQDLVELTKIPDNKNQSSLTLVELIVLMKGDLKENVESLIQINKDFPHLLME